MKKSISQFIVLVLIVTVFSTSLITPIKYVHAGITGSQTLDYDNPNKNGDNPYRISLKGVINSGLLTSLVGCTGIVDKVSKVTVQFAQNLLKSKTERLQLKQEAETEKNNAVAGVDGTATKQAQKDALAKKDRDDAKAFTDNCLNGIATTLAKNQLAAMTKYTVNWITTGFNGDPMYVRDVNSYVDSLTTDLLKKENDLFKNPANSSAYPYGRDYAIGQVNSYKASQDSYGSLKQDLTNYLTPGATPESFGSDFSQGGWNGWLALTQHPENNPLGFTLKATENLGKQQANATENAKAELARNGGVFDQKKCVEYEKIKVSAPICNANGIPVDELPPDSPCTSGTHPATAPTTTAPKCIKYETVTPGSVIKGKIDTYINSPERQIELARTLNDSLNALFSALINKFEEQGLSGLKSKSNNFTTVSGGFGSNSITDAIGNSIASATSSIDTSGRNLGPFDITRDLGNKYVEAINSGTWDANTNTPELVSDTGIKNQYYTVSQSGYTKLFATPTHHWVVGEKAFFDGTKWRVGVPAHIVDTRGVFQIQKDYLASIKKANVLLPQVIPKLAELDYCIPGPNQNWESNSLNAKNELFSYLGEVGTEHVTEIWSAQEEGCFAGCFFFNGIASIAGGGRDHSYDKLILPDPAPYKKIFDDARNLWNQITALNFFYIVHPVRSNYSFGNQHDEVDPTVVANTVTNLTNLATTKYDEYVIKARNAYGINSSMRTEFTPQGNPNPEFLPMAQAGLDLTKNIVTDAEDLPKAINEAEDNLAQANGTTYRLGFIKDKVNLIIAAAQARRKAQRIADGLPAMPQICLDNEKVTYLENGVLKY